MRHTVLSIVSVVSLGLFDLFHCGVNPPDPAIDPANANAVLVVEGSGSTYVNQGDSRKIGLYLNYPHHFKKISIASECGILDTIIKFDTTKNFDTLHFTAVFRTVGKCPVILTATYTDETRPVLQTRLEFSVDPGTPGLEFVKVPASFKTHTGNVDTLLFVTKTKGSALAQSYAVSSLPPIDPSQLFRLPSVNNDTAKVIFDPAAADSYTVSITATAQVPASIPVTAMATVGVRVFADLTPSKVDAPQNIVTGTADTLRFAVDNSTRADKLTIKLVTDKPLDPAIFTVLPSGLDSVVIAVAAVTTAASTTKIGISTSNGTIVDTSWYPITFIDKSSLLWNQTELALPATEGVQLRYDLKPYLVPQSGIVTLSADVGTVTADTFWQYTPAYGSVAAVKAVVTAQKGSASLGLTLNVTVAPGDTTAPVITRADPGIDGKNVSSPQITVNCTVVDKEAGVAGVVFAYAGKSVIATALPDNGWTGVIDGLENGKATEVTITATDKSMRKNSASVKFTVTYTATAPDEEPPVITLIDPSTSNDTVYSESCTVEVSCTDASGIGSVLAESNGKTFNAEPLNTHYVMHVSGLKTGSNTVTIKAQDASTKKNEAVKPLVVVRMEPVTIAYNANGSTAGTVPVDTVKYRSTAVITVASNTGKLEKTGARFVSWNTMTDGTGKDYKEGDTIIAKGANIILYAKWAVKTFVVAFDTKGGSAVASQTVVYGATVTSPASPPTKTGYTFSGWYKEAAYTTPWNFTLETVSEDLTIYAKWTIITCTVTFDAKGGSTVAQQTVNYGATITAPNPVPTKTGYTFGGWYKEEAFTNQWNFSTDVVTTGVTIYAKWTLNTFTVTFNTQGGSSIASQTVNYGGTATSPAVNPTRTGYTFNGWYKEAAATTAWNFTVETITAAAIIYAGWTINSYTVAFDAQGGSAVTSQSITYGGHVTKPSVQPTKTSYIFRGWYKETAGTNPWNFTNDAVSGTTTLYAKWAIMDADSNVYTEVKIGTQIWMVENLKTTKYNDGTPITLTTDSASWTGFIASDAYCWYNNDPANKNTYGALYGGGIVYHEKPLAPVGWHIPTMDEWNAVVNVLGDASTAGGMMKDAGTTYWDAPNTGGSNSSGFKALPGGRRAGSSQDIKKYGYWWTSTVGEVMSYVGCSISNTSASINTTGGYLISNGLSVRCVRDW